MNTEAGVAYVQLLPSMKGFSRAVTSELGSSVAAPMKSAGADAGKTLAAGIGDGVDGAKGKFETSASKVGDIFKAGLKVAGLAAGALLAVGLTEGLQAEAATDKLVAQLGGGQWAEDAGDLAAKLYGDAFGSSLAEVNESVRTIMQGGLFNGDESAEEIERLTAKALTFSDVMEQDLGMTTQAVARILRNGLAGSADEAFDVLTKGIQSGADESGDLIESFQEYGPLFKDLGLSASDAVGLMSQGLAGGARDADKVADALKELAIRAQDGSASSAEGFAAIGLSAEEMTAKFAEGGAAARAGLDEVLDGLRSIEDPVARNAAAVALFGTQAEDMGDALFALDIDTAAAGLGDMEGATDKLGEAYQNASTKITAFKRQALQKLTDFVGGTVIPGIERLAHVLGPPISAAIDGVMPALESLQAFFNTLFSGFTEDEGTPIEMIALSIRDAFAELEPALESFRQVWSDVSTLLAENSDMVKGALTGVAIAITGLLIPALVGLAVPMVAAVAPFVLAGAAVAALGAAFVWLYQNVEEFQVFVDTALPKIGEIFRSTFEIILQVVDRTVQAATFIWENFGEEITTVARIAMDLVLGIIGGSMDVMLGVVNTVLALLQGDWRGAMDGLQQITDGFTRILLSILNAAWESVKASVRLLWRAVRALFGDGIDAAESLVRSGLDAIVTFFRGLPGRVRRAFTTLASAITRPFRSAFGSIKSLWNSTVGGFSFSLPSWIPGVGGNSFSIPSMHTGGIVPGRGDVLRNLQGGEGVFTADQMAALPDLYATEPAPQQGAQIDMYFDGLDDSLKRWIRKIVRTEGQGDVQVTFGAG